MLCAKSTFLVLKFSLRPSFFFDYLVICMPFKLYLANRCLQLNILRAQHYSSANSKLAFSPLTCWCVLPVCLPTWPLTCLVSLHSTRRETTIPCFHFLARFSLSFICSRQVYITIAGSQVVVVVAVVVVRNKEITKQPLLATLAVNVTLPVSCLHSQLVGKLEMRRSSFSTAQSRLIQFTLNQYLKRAWPAR